MSFSKVFSAQSTLVSANRIDIETDVSRGLHQFNIVGLADKAIDESKDRVSAAIKNSGFKSPRQKNEKIVVSLAPAHVHKTGPLFDLPIALSYLSAVGDIDFENDKRIFLGELALDGSVRPVNGVLPLVRFAKENNFKEIYVPLKNTKEASLISGIKIFPVKDLRQVIDHLENRVKIKTSSKTKIEKYSHTFLPDMSEIKGQNHAKRALQIAAAGGHNIALFGPPGTGKTFLAKAFAGVLPKLSFKEMLDVTSIHSVANLLKEKIITHPPIRSPHHTSSYVSIFGGGANIRPGEVTLSHKGILVLDEFPEFEKRVLEGLRQPLEDKQITISRAQGSVCYPADFILVATLNPCPCGYQGSKTKKCACTSFQVLRYQQKISGPIMDRIDMWIEVDQLEHKELISKNKIRSQSKDMRREVNIARQKQIRRYKKINISCNANLSPKQIEENIFLEKEVQEILLSAAKKLQLSARSYHKVIKLSQTICDLENKNKISKEHVLEALQYRPKGWG